MNILFVCKYPTCLSENLKYKFDGQMNACMELGYEVWYIEWNGFGFHLKCRNSGQSIPLCKGGGTNQERYYHTLYFLTLYKCVKKAVKKMKFDYIYMRYMPFFPPISGTLDKIKADGNKVIIEIPSYPFEKEIRKDVNKARYLIFKFLWKYQRRVMLKANLLAVCGEFKGEKVFGVKAVNLYNGIDVEAQPLRVPTDVQDEIHILLLASMCYWHGYDRVIEGLRRYKGKTKVVAHFVGADGDGSLAKWKELAHKYHLGKQVVFHGSLYADELERMFHQADVGIASLGLYRKHMRLDSSLKTREYMSRGLPFVCMDGVMLLDYSLPYVMKVSNNEEPIDIEAVVAFAKSNKANKDTPELMRSYARENMSWVTEFKKIMAQV